MVVLYLDDLVMAGPDVHRDQVCKEVSQVIELGEWTDLGRYLGCHHDVRRCTDNSEYNGSWKTSFQMHDYLANTVNRYKEITGITSFKNVGSPYLDLH